jgi:hypothetical protein
METALTILVVIVILAGLSMEMKMGRANRIARASHDILKAMADEQKRGNDLLAKIVEEGNSQRSMPNAEPPMKEKTEPSIYKI